MSKKKKHNFRKKIFVLSAIVAIIVGSTKIYDRIMQCKKKDFDVTVQVHGNDSIGKRINHGEIILKIDIDTIKATIDENGKAEFKQLPADYKGKKCIFNIEHPKPYKPVNPSKEYKLKKGTIYLEIERKEKDQHSRSKSQEEKPNRPKANEKVYLSVKSSGDPIIEDSIDHDIIYLIIPMSNSPSALSIDWGNGYQKPEKSDIKKNGDFYSIRHDYYTIGKKVIRVKENGSVIFENEIFITKVQ